MDKNGFTEVWYNPHSIHKETFLAILKPRLTVNFIVELRAGSNHSTSMSLFGEISETFDLSSYLLKIQNHKQTNAITKLRLSSHSLFIETGRHTGVTRENRKCTLCNKVERKAMIRNRYNYPTPAIRDIKGKNTQARNNWTLMETSLAESQTDSYFPTK